VWESEDDTYYEEDSYCVIYAQRYNNAGIPQGIVFRVSMNTVNSQSNPSVAMDAQGNFVVAYESYGQDGSLLGIYGNAQK